MYMVYGKKKTDKRFKPFDMKDNKFVVNLFHASLFTEEEKEMLDKEISYMNKMNNDYIFEVRSKK